MGMSRAAVASRANAAICVVAAGALWVAGCGSSAAVPPPTTAEAFIEQYCGIYQPCCQPAGLPSDGQSCRSYFANLAPAGGFDAQAAAACLEGMRLAARTPGFCDGKVAEVVDCSRALKEPDGKSPGEPCSRNAECAASPEGDTVCPVSPATGVTVSACRLEIRGVAGSSPCIYTVEGLTKTATGSPAAASTRFYECHLQDGLYCDDATDSCLPLIQREVPCRGFQSCVAGAFCELGGVCTPHKPVGATCAGDLFECVPSAFCSTATPPPMCATRLPPGAACSQSSECASRVCTNSLCGRGNPALQVLCGRG
jgi:hypothetical protein